MKLLNRLKKLFKKPIHKCKFKQVKKFKSYTRKTTFYTYACECGKTRKGKHRW